MSRAQALQSRQWEKFQPRQVPLVETLLLQRRSLLNHQQLRWLPNLLAQTPLLDDPGVELILQFAVLRVHAESQVQPIVFRDMRELR